MLVRTHNVSQTPQRNGNLAVQERCQRNSEIFPAQDKQDILKYQSVLVHLFGCHPPFQTTNCIVHRLYQAPNLRKLKQKKKIKLQQENTRVSNKSHSRHVAGFFLKRSRNFEFQKLPHPDKPRQDASPSHIQGLSTFRLLFLQEADATLGAATSSKMLLLCCHPCSTLSCPPDELPTLPLSPWLQEGDDPTFCSALLGASRLFTLSDQLTSYLFLGGLLRCHLKHLRLFAIRPLT